MILSRFKLFLLGVVIGLLIALGLELSVRAAEIPQVKIAVIDTGIDRLDRPELCSSGHKDFTGKGLTDIVGHGTNISGLIHKGAKGTSYCQVIIKYFHNFKSPGTENMDNFVKALRYAIDLKVNYINYSGYGRYPNKEETKLVKEALDKGIVIVAASGNERVFLDKDNCTVFPACADDRIIVVSRDDFASQPSGFGPRVNYYEKGYNQKANGITMSGTSQATAVVSGKLIGGRK